MNQSVNRALLITRAHLSAAIASLTAAADGDAAWLGLQAAGAIEAFTPPAIGEYWPGQGGIYRGLVRGEKGEPDHHVIEAVAWLDNDHRKNWQDAKAWASKLTADGHADFQLPNRRELALIWTNRDADAPAGWTWSRDEHSASYAWCCGFGNGYQNHNHKSYEAAARAVRRFVA